MKRITQLALFLLLSIVGRLHAQNISTGITDAGAALPFGTVDPNWRITASPTGPSDAINFNGISLWETSPVTGSNAGWINGTGNPCSNPIGYYTFERSFTVSNATTSFTASLRAAYDDALTLELVDPNGTAIPLTIVPTTIYHLSSPITHTETAPLAGTWRIRAVLEIVTNGGPSGCGAFMLEGDISTDCNPSCNCNILKPSFDKQLNLCEGIFNSTSEIPLCIKEAGTETYEWFVDGISVGTTSSLSYTFPANGTYEVCLKVTGTLPDGSHCEKKFCEDIIVDGCTGCTCDDVIPNIDYNVDKCAGFFNGTLALPPCLEGAPVSYNWYINSAYAGSGSTLSYPFPGNGTYTVCFSTTVIMPDGKKCTKEACVQIVVNNCGECRCKDLIPDFNYTVDKCKATFVNTTTGPDCIQRTYKWFVDSVLVGTGNTFSYTFPGSGTYTVCMKVVGVMPGGVPCKPYICKEVTVDCGSCNCNLLKPSFETQLNNCEGFFTSTSDFPPCVKEAGTDGYYWTVDGNYAGSSATLNYTFPSNGTYVVCLTITGTLPDGTKCEKKICENIEVTGCTSCCENMIPKITYNVDKCSAILNGSTTLPECLNGAPVTYEWFINSGYAGSGSTLIYPFPGNGVYNVCLYATIILADGTKCTQDTCIQVVVNNCGECRCKDVIPDFSYSVSNCVGTFVNTTTGPDCVQRTYKWFVDSVLVGTGSTFNYTFPGSGTYTICMKVVGTMPGGVPCKPYICKEITVDCGPCNCYDLDASFNFSFNQCNGTFVSNSHVPACLANVTYEWIVDGTTTSGSGTTFNYGFSTFGPHTVCLKVSGTMPDGTSCTRNACYDVYPPELCPDPCATCSNIQPNFTVSAGCNVVFDGSSSSVPACLQNAVYRWYVGVTGSGVASPVGTGSILNYTFPGSGSYTVCLMISGNLPDGTYCEKTECRDVYGLCLIANPADLRGQNNQTFYEKSVNLYPNPANDHLTIEMELEDASEVQFIMRSSDGKELLNEKQQSAAGLQRFELKIPESVANSMVFIEVIKGNEKVIRMVAISKE